MRVFYAQAIYGEEEIEAVLEVLRDRPLTLVGGPAVKEFETRVAELFGKDSGLMVNSGSSANTLAVACLGLESGAEVITPALTFSTTVAPLVHHGLIPAFVDVEPDTYNIDVERVEAMIGPKTRALMVPNLIGNLPDWQALRAIADRHGLKVIEDSADTIGYRYRGATTGDISDIVTTSFYASHVITAGGFGGMVCFRDEALKHQGLKLRGWGRSSSVLNESERIEERLNVELDGIPYDNKFLFESIGHNFLPSEMGAAFGLVQLARLPEYGRRRVENFQTLSAFFKDYEDWFVLPRQREETETYWLAMPLIVKQDAPFSRRDIQTYLESRDVQTRTVFTGNILRQPGFRNIERREDPAGYGNADRVMQGGLLIGCHQGMDAAQIDYVREVFRDFAEQQ